MNIHDIDIELPPLPPLHIVPSVEPVDYPEVAQVLLDYARAAIEPYKQRIEELEAQLEAIGAGGVSSQRITSQRRGEPVAFAKDGNLFWRGDPVAWREFSGELYLAPQPVEPDYKQLFEQMCERCDALDAKLAEYSEREPVARVNDDGFIVETGLGLAPGTLLYTAPQPAEPVEVPSPHEFNTGNEKLDALLDDTFYLAKDGGMDNAIKWQESLEEFLASIEPVKVPPCET